MSNPVVFDDICKKAKDVLNDDYFVGTKLTMKIKHIKGVNVTAEAKADTGKPVVSKVTGDFKPCDYCDIKKLSVDSTGAMIADMDLTKLIKKTTFTIRTQKNYNESGMKKAAIGAKVMTDSVAFDTSFDVASQNYNAGLVYSFHGMMMGAKMSGTGSKVPTADFGMSYTYKDMVASFVSYDLFKKMDMTLFYTPCDNTRVSAICRVAPGSGVAPLFDMGVAYKVTKESEVRAKVSSNGEVNGCFKTIVDDKMTFSGSMTVDAKNINAGNHRIGLGLEFMF